MQVGGYGGEGHKMLTANSEEMFKVLSLETYFFCNVMWLLKGKIMT